MRHEGNSARVENVRTNKTVFFCCVCMCAPACYNLMFCTWCEVILRRFIFALKPYTVNHVGMSFSLTRVFSARSRCHLIFVVVNMKGRSFVRESEL